MNNHRIRLLDTTLRDGGLGLEDAYKNGIANRGYNEDLREQLVNQLRRSNIDIIELGSLEKTNQDNRRFEIYETIEDISKNMPQNHNPSQLYAALFRGPDIPLTEIPEWRPGLCEAVRLIVRYSELQKSLDYCRGLVGKGYKVFIQPMLTMRYTNDELDLIIREANDMKAYAVYFVDSYGYMTGEDTLRFAKLFDEQLNPEICLGFHGHNNMNLAFANAKAFLSYPTERNVIVDSCFIGMGQGAGNLQTEIIADYLNRHYGKQYDYDAVLDGCEQIESFLQPNLWGYSVTTLIPAILHVAYKYAIVFRNQYKLSYKEIYHILSHIPENMRHRYTPDNASILVRDFNKG